MAERIWDRYLTERDKEVLVATGYGQRGGFGKLPNQKSGKTGYQLKAGQGA